MKKDTKTTSKENESIIDMIAATEDVIDLTDVDESADIDYDLVTSGPLYFDPRNLAPGYVPCFVSDKPGEIEMYKRYGYEVVIDKFRVGDEKASTSSRFGSAVTVQSKCGQLLVLMAIREELHAKLMSHREKKNRERDSAMLGKIDGIDPRYQEFNGKSLSEYKITKKY